MLTLTVEQLSALESSLEGDFVQRVAVRLNEVFADQMVRVRASGGDAGVLEFVRNAVRRAEALGLERERDLATFIVVLLTNAQLQGKDVGFYGWARPLFDRPNTAGHIKIAMIEHRLQVMRTRNPLAERFCLALEATVDGF